LEEKYFFRIEILLTTFKIGQVALRGLAAQSCNPTIYTSMGDNNMVGGCLASWVTVPLGGCRGRRSGLNSTAMNLPISGATDHLNLSALPIQSPALDILESKLLKIATQVYQFSFMGFFNLNCFFPYFQS